MARGRQGLSSVGGVQFGAVHAALGEYQRAMWGAIVAKR